ncbi:MAG: thiamine-phosphate kinase, partial [Bacteroidota bacterium]
MLNNILENALIENLVKIFPRSPLQQNSLQESDAELLHFPGTDSTIALTTDTIVEEIEAGLYTDPHLIGWMTVMVNASDLAAVGAQPIGILLNETLPPDVGEEFIAELQNGIHDACSICGMYVLGGDTNFSSHLQMSGCAVGLIPDSAAMTRRGCEPGDYLFSSGPLGLGNAYALVHLMNNSELKQIPMPYYPRARLCEGQLLRSIASCCMDTSDGTLATLDQLMR